MIVKHLKLCNGQIRLTSIIFQLELYIGTMFNYLHMVKAKTMVGLIEFRPLKMIP